MTKNSDLKDRIRARMRHTGENYTAARAAILAKEPPELPDLTALSPDDRRFFIKTARGCFMGQKLINIPAKRKARVVVLLMLLTRFVPGRQYSEPEVNEILATADDDYASLRRELVNYGYLDRRSGVYWVACIVPEHSKQVGQETPSSEAAFLQSFWSTHGV